MEEVETNSFIDKCLQFIYNIIQIYKQKMLIPVAY